MATACENESHNAKRMRLGLEPVSQPMPILPGATVSTLTHIFHTQHCLSVCFFFLDVNPYGYTNDPCILLCMFQPTDTTAGMGQARSLDFPGGGVIKLENTDSTIGSFPSSTTPTSTATSKTIPVSQDNKTSLW